MDIEIKDQLVMLTHFLLGSEFIKEPSFKSYVKKRSNIIKEESITKYKTAESDIKNFIEDAMKSINVVGLPKQLSKNKPVKQFMDGVFDITHSGHMNALRRAKSLCDILVVGVISDEQVLKYKSKPLMNIHERAKIPRACKWVDQVITKGVNYCTSLEDLDRYDCVYQGHGDDMIAIDGKDIYEEIKNADRLKIFKRTEGISTTDMMGKLFTLLSSKIKITLDKKKDTELEQIRNKIDSELTILKEDSKTNFQLLSSSKRLSQFSNKRLPTPEDKVIYTAGTFDVLNGGHIDFLEEAKKLGTYLIVGIYDDNLVSQYKGKEYPIQNLNERVLAVLALRCVDEVIIGAPWDTTKEVCQTLKCRYVVQGQTSVGKQYTKYSDPNEYPKEEKIHMIVETDNSFTLNTMLERLLQDYPIHLEGFKKKTVRQENYYNNQLEGGSIVTKDVIATDD